MAQIPNVTERIAELREFKKAKSLSQSPYPPPPTRAPKVKRVPPKAIPAERRIATSYWVIAIYTVLFGALLTQLLLIALLDIL